MRYLRLLRTITLVFYLYSTLIACNVQKKRYSHGFYFGNQKSVTTKSINQELQIDSDSSLTHLLSKKLIEDHKEKAALKPNMSPERLPELSISNELKKLTQIVVSDTIQKNKVLENEDKLKQPRKKIELFSLLSFCVYTLTVLMFAVVFIAGVSYTVTEFIIFLSLFNFLLYPFIQFILAIIGYFRIKRHPSKYRETDLAVFLMLASIITFFVGFFMWVFARLSFGNYDL